MTRHGMLTLLTGVALIVCAPALGQTAASSVSIPDLSGIWGRNWFLFEPPLSGPGPIASKLRRPNGTLILIPIVGDYSNPILRPQAVEAVKKRGELEPITPSKAGGLKGNRHRRLQRILGQMMGLYEGARLSCI